MGEPGTLRHPKQAEDPRRLPQLLRADTSFPTVPAHLLRCMAHRLLNESAE